MATENYNVNNGTSHDDSFDRDIQQVMQDGPSLNSMGSVQAGEQDIDLSGGDSYVPPQNRSVPTNFPRSQTVPPANTSISLTSPHSQNGSRGGSAGVGASRSRAATTGSAQSKLDSFKSWSLNTYKCTKQVISEKLGKTNKTVDVELETQIENLRDMQRKYANILKLARSLANHFSHVVLTQRALSESFMELAQKSPELEDEFGYNAETQKALCKNGEVLLGALNFFISSVNTLCNKTIEDTLLTVKNYETSRVEYDAYRADFEQVQSGPSRDAGKLEEGRKKFEFHKAKFDQLRADVAIKIRFLDENRVKVMHKQLLLFHNAISAYFSGNQSALEGTLKQFSIKLKSPNSEPPSWLEN